MPNKAVAGSAAGAGGTTVAGALVAILLYNLGSTPPQEIVIAYTTIASVVVGALSTFAGVYFTKMEGQVDGK